MAARVVALEELAKHNTRNDLWIAVKGKVYDVTTYRDDHPGGIEAIAEVAGQDATQAFEDVGHSASARETLATFLIGSLEGAEEDNDAKEVVRKLVDSNVPVATKKAAFKLSPAVTRLAAAGLLTIASIIVSRQATTKLGENAPELLRTLLRLLPTVTATISSGLAIVAAFNSIPSLAPPRTYPAHVKMVDQVSCETKKPSPVLDPKNPIKLPISEIQQLTPDTKKFVVKFPNDTDKLGLPIGQHVTIHGPANAEGKCVKRSYTPSTLDCDTGRLEVIIKMYPGGALTGNYLDKLVAGDSLTLSGPKGKMRYRAGYAQRLGMLAAGSGITPMWQLIRSICENPSDNTRVTLVFANRAEHDIILRKELDALAEANPQKLEVVHILSKPCESWTGLRGRCDRALLEKVLPSAEDKSNKALVCGPPGFEKNAKEWLFSLGFDKARTVSKMEDQIFMF